MTQYVALLRGINVGGRNIKMADLRAALASWGYQQVKSVLASGNVVFEAESTDPDAISAAIEAGIKETFGYDVHVLLRPAQAILDLVGEQPFEISGDERNPALRYLPLRSAEPHPGDFLIPPRRGIIRF